MLKESSRDCREDEVGSAIGVGRHHVQERLLRLIGERLCHMVGTAVRSRNDIVNKLWKPATPLWNRPKLLPIETPNLSP